MTWKIDSEGNKYISDVDLREALMKPIEHDDSYDGKDGEYTLGDLLTIIKVLKNPTLERINNYEQEISEKMNDSLGIYPPKTCTQALVDKALADGYIIISENGSLFENDSANITKCIELFGKRMRELGCPEYQIKNALESVTGKFAPLFAPKTVSQAESMARIKYEYYLEATEHGMTTTEYASFQSREQYKNQ